MQSSSDFKSDLLAVIELNETSRMFESHGPGKEDHFTVACEIRARLIQALNKATRFFENNLELLATIAQLRRENADLRNQHQQAEEVLNGRISSLMSIVHQQQCELDSQGKIISLRDIWANLLKSVTKDISWQSYDGHCATVIAWISIQCAKGASEETPCEQFSIHHIANMMRDLYSSAEGINVTLREENTALRKALNESAAQREKMSEEISKLKQNVAEVQMQCEDWRSLSRELCTQFRSADDINKNLRERISSLESEVLEHRESVSVWRNKCHEILDALDVAALAATSSQPPPRSESHMTPSNPSRVSDGSIYERQYMSLAEHQSTPHVPSSDRCVDNNVRAHAKTEFSLDDSPQLHNESCCQSKENGQSGYISTYTQTDLLPSTRASKKEKHATSRSVQKSPYLVSETSSRIILGNSDGGNGNHIYEVDEADRISGSGSMNSTPQPIKESRRTFSHGEALTPCKVHSNPSLKTPRTAPARVSRANKPKPGTRSRTPPPRRRSRSPTAPAYTPKRVSQISSATPTTPKWNPYFSSKRSDPKSEVKQLTTASIYDQEVTRMKLAYVEECLGFSSGRTIEPTPHTERTVSQFTRQSRAISPISKTNMLPISSEVRDNCNTSELLDVPDEQVYDLKNHLKLDKRENGFVVNPHKKEITSKHENYRYHCEEPGSSLNDFSFDGKDESMEIF